MSSFVWALITSSIWGIVPIFEKIGLNKTSPMVGLFYRCIGVFLGVIILGFFVLKPQEIKSVDIKSASLLVFSGLLGSFIGQLCFYRALSGADVSRVVPISGSYPFISFLLGIILLSEPISLPRAIGCLLVIAGIFLLK